MKLSNLHRYLLHQLVKEKTSVKINTVKSNIDLSLIETSKISNLEDSLSNQKVAKIQTLLTEHQSLSSNRDNSFKAKELSKIEKQILTILGLEPNVLNYVSLLNRLTKIAVKYLGKKIVASYWSSTQINEDELKELFQIEDSGQITVKNDKNITLNEEQKQKINLWIGQFINKTSLIVQDFEKIILTHE